MTRRHTHIPPSVYKTNRNKRRTSRSSPESRSQLNRNFYLTSALAVQEYVDSFIVHDYIQYTSWGRNLFTKIRGNSKLFLEALSQPQSAGEISSI